MTGLRLKLISPVAVALFAAIAIITGVIGSCLLPSGITRPVLSPETTVPMFPQLTAKTGMQVTDFGYNLGYEWSYGIS